MTVAGGLIRQVRRACALTQRQLAAVASEHQPSIAAFERGRHSPTVDHLERLVAPLGYRVTVVPTRCGTAADAADAIHAWLLAGDHQRAYRELIQLNDDLATEHGAIRVVLTVTPAARTGDPRLDAFLAALVEHHLTEEHLPVPAWTDEPGRHLEAPWSVDRFADADIAARTPAAFLRHNVLVEAAELASV